MSTQSTTCGVAGVASDGVVSTVVDGNIDTQLNGGSCTHTTASNDPWWRVDFGREVKVTGLLVYNRADNLERLQGFSVYVGNNVVDVLVNAACAVNQNAPLSCPYKGNVTCDAPVSGQYLYIFLEGTSRVLSLCEVQGQGYFCTV